LYFKEFNLLTKFNYSNKDKSEEIQAFIKSNESFGITCKDIAQMIKTTIDPSRFMNNNPVGAEIFKAFIESERSVGITRENVAEIIKYV
jgi:DNA-binding transcriptional regulator YhcF (GntR family)